MKGKAALATGEIWTCAGELKGKVALAMGEIWAWAGGGACICARRCMAESTECCTALAITMCWCICCC